MAKSEAKGTLYILAVITIIIGVATAIAMAYRHREGKSSQSTCKQECLQKHKTYYSECANCCVDPTMGGARPKYDQDAEDCMETTCSPHGCLY